MYGMGQLYLQARHKSELRCLQLRGAVSHVQWLQQPEPAQIQHTGVSRQAVQPTCHSQILPLS